MYQPSSRRRLSLVLAVVAGVIAVTLVLLTALP